MFSKNLSWHNKIWGGIASECPPSPAETGLVIRRLFIMIQSLFTNSEKLHHLQHVRAGYRKKYSILQQRMRNVLISLLLRGLSQLPFSPSRIRPIVTMHVRQLTTTYKIVRKHIRNEPSFSECEISKCTACVTQVNSHNSGLLCAYAIAEITKQSFLDKLRHTAQNSSRIKDSIRIIAATPSNCKRS